MAPWNSASIRCQSLPEVDDFQQSGAETGDLRALLGAGVERGLADDDIFQGPAHLQQPQQRLALEPHHGRHQPARGGHAGGEESAGAAPAPDQAKAFPAV